MPGPSIYPWFRIKQFLDGRTKGESYAIVRTRQELGMAACTAIVIGNMVGSGFYLSPAAVAPYGNLAILIWLVIGAGAICLGLTFAKLARLAPAPVLFVMM